MEVKEGDSQWLFWQAEGLATIILESFKSSNNPLPAMRPFWQLGLCIPPWNQIITDGDFCLWERIDQTPAELLNPSSKRTIESCMAKACEKRKKRKKKEKRSGIGSKEEITI